MDEKTAKAIAANIRILVDNVVRLALIEDKKKPTWTTLELSQAAEQCKELTWHANKAEANIAKILQEKL